jgi:triacylglycerol lipase
MIAHCGRGGQNSPVSHPSVGRARAHRMTAHGFTALCCAALAACHTAPPRPASPGGQRPPQDYPVVLVHGLSGFRTLSGVDYFFGVPAALQRAGHRVFVPEVPPWAPVELRAQHLATQVDEIVRRTGAPRVHVVAHSMGGLDARHMITTLGRGPKVASLTTIGTPHRGTPLADNYDRINLAPTHPLQDLSADFFIWTLGGLHVHSDTAGAVQSLSQARAVQFNAQNPDHPAVRYYSFAGRTLGHDGRGFCDDAAWPNPTARHAVVPNLLGSAVFLSGPKVQQPVANDGLVTVPSARWGTFMGCLPADHMREVGHPPLPPVPGAWDHLAFYVDWAQRLTRGTLP